MREARQRRVPQIRRAGAVWRNGALGPIRKMRVMVQGDVSLGEGSCAVVGVCTEIQEVKLRCVLLWFVAAKHKLATQRRKAQNRGRAGFLSVYVGTHSYRCARRYLGSFSEAKKASRTIGSYARGKTSPGFALCQKWGEAWYALICPAKVCPGKPLSFEV